MNKLNCRYVVGSTIYRPHTDHMIDFTDHIPTTQTLLPTTYRPHTDHLSTTYRPLTDHIPTTLPTTYRQFNLFTITNWNGVSRSRVHGTGGPNSPGFLSRFLSHFLRKISRSPQYLPIIRFHKNTATSMRAFLHSMPWLRPAFGTMH